MQNLRTIRRKIRAVRNIQKITQAMKMVAAARLRRVQDRALAGHPYAQKLEQIVETIAPYVATIEHPLLELRQVNRVGLVVVTGDKGLCGAYNSNVIRIAVEFIEERQAGGCPVSIFCVGRKGGSYFVKRDYSVHRAVEQISVHEPFREAQRIAWDIVDWFTSGNVDEVHFAYTEFKSASIYYPRMHKLLPIERPSGEPTAPFAVEYIFEPPAHQLLAILLPRYVENQIYQILLDSLASELAARVQAMTAASENAADMLEELTLQANKIRQWVITKELLEITTAAEALRYAQA